MIKTKMNDNINLSRIHELELLYWNTVIKILGAWQEITQPTNPKKALDFGGNLRSIRLEYFLIAAAGLGFGLLIGALGI